MKPTYVTMFASAAIATILFGCGAQSQTDEEEPTVAQTSAALDVDLPLTHFDDTVMPYSTRSRSIIQSASEYQYYIGHAPPSWIDFNQVWVVFATTGTTPTDGFEMHIDRMRFFTNFGYNLYPYFREVSPGAGCPVSPTASQANALATFPIPPQRPRRTRFQNTYEVHNCATP